MPDRSERGAVDPTRRRLIAGLGLLGVGAIGGGLHRVLATEPGPAGGSGSPPVVSSGQSVRPPDPATTGPVSSGDTPASTVPPPPPPTTTLAPATAVVACRDAWGAEPAGSGLVEHVPVRLTLHHTAVSQTSAGQGPARARQHQRYHQSLGWPDLAYHFLVDRTGLAYAGRDVRFRGDTGTEYDPTGHFLVCMEGDFDVQEPTSAQLDTTVALFAWAVGRFGIDASTLAGHGAYAETSCPGASVAPLVPSLVGAVASLGPVTLDERCGPAGAEMVAAVEVLDR